MDIVSRLRKGACVYFSNITGLCQLQRLPDRTLLSIVRTINSLYLYSGKICDSRDGDVELEKGETDIKATPRRMGDGAKMSWEYVVGFIEAY